MKEKNDWYVVVDENGKWVFGYYFDTQSEAIIDAERLKKEKPDLKMYLHHIWFVREI